MQDSSNTSRSVSSPNKKVILHAAAQSTSTDATHIAHQLSQKQLLTMSYSPIKKRSDLINIEKQKPKMFNLSKSITPSASLVVVASQHPSPTKTVKALTNQKNKVSTGKVKAAKQFPVQPHQKKVAKVPAAQAESEYGDYGDSGSDRDPSNDSYWFTSSDEEEEDDYELDAEELAWRAQRMVMYAKHTHYDVIKEAAKFNFEYHLTKRENCQWDIAWSDGPITIQFLQRMQPYQRTNHLPGIYNLAKKNMLGRHLTRLQSVFPEDYDFFPQTYNLPADFKEFQNQVTKKRNRTFIVKPEASCQGKGIFLTRDPEQLTTEKTIHTTNGGVVEHMVVQRYMHKPYLIDGYKFDLRIYVLINGISPLRVYIYKDGLARFATVKYQSPAPSNLNNLCMHLTNYAINKESSDFVHNTSENADDVGSKRSYQHVLNKIQQRFGSMTSDRIKGEINDIIVKTLCMAQPHVNHLFKTCHPDDMDNSLCFQILGFDIMIDHKLKPSLIEVNQMPSFATDSPLDYKIKLGVINDTIAILDLSAKRRARIKNQKRMELQRRLLKGYSHKIPKNLSVNQQTMQKKKDKKGEEDQEAAANTTPSMQTIKQGGKISQITSEQSKPKAPQVSKVEMKQLAMQSKQDLIIKRRMQREKKEAALCGGYELVYPFVSYAEEELIKNKVEMLKHKGNTARSIKNLIGWHVPKTLKEKLAEKEQLANKDDLVKKSSQKSLESGQDLQFGEGTIEYLAIRAIIEESEQEADESETNSQQQGCSEVVKQESDDANLEVRWLKQVQYENFMECAHKMWDQFTSGTAVKQQRRKRAQEEEQQKLMADKEAKDKQRRDLAKKQLMEKLRRQAEERRRAEEIKNMISIEEEAAEVEEQRAGERSKSRESISGSQLNMAELQKQHQKLRDQIHEQQQQFIVEGLQKHRKSSMQLGPDRQEVRRSMKNIQFEGQAVHGYGQHHNVIQRKASTLSQNAPSANGQDRRQTNNASPHVDYFKHVLQNRKQQRHQHVKISQAYESQDSDQVGYDDDHAYSGQTSQRRASVSAVDLRKSGSKVNFDDQQEFQAEENKLHLQYAQTELKAVPITSAFPLDHLPIFNMNTPIDSSSKFTPQTQVSRLGKDLSIKDRRGIIKGTTVHAGSLISTRKSPISDPLGYGHLRTQPSQALLNPILKQHGSGPNSSKYGPNSGFRDRKMTDAAHYLRQQKQNNTQMLNPAQSYVTSTFQPAIDGGSITDSLRFQSSNPERDYDNILRKIGSECGGSQRPELQSNISVMRSIEPVMDRFNMSTLSQDKEVRDPHVIKIDLPVNRSKENTQMHTKHYVLQDIKPIQQFNSPQTDIASRWTRKEPFINNTTHHYSQKAPVPGQLGQQQQVTSDASIHSNIINASSFAYQRNSKLNELFAKGARNVHPVQAAHLVQRLQQPLIKTEKPNTAANKNYFQHNKLRDSINQLLPELSDQHRSKEMTGIQLQARIGSRTNSIASQLNYNYGPAAETNEMSQSFQTGAKNPNCNIMDMLVMSVGDNGSPEQQLSLPVTSNTRVAHKSYQAPHATHENQSIGNKSSSGQRQNGTNMRHPTVFSNMTASDQNYELFTTKKTIATIIPEENKRFGDQKILLSNRLSSIHQSSQGEDGVIDPNDLQQTNVQKTQL